LLLYTTQLEEARKMADNNGRVITIAIIIFLTVLGGIAIKIIRKQISEEIQKTVPDLNLQKFVHAQVKSGILVFE
jgi:hypothetical protein